MSIILEFDNVTCRKGKESQQNTIFQSLSFSMDESEMVTLMGPSGSGKSTLLRAIIGLDPIDEGTIYFKGKPIEQWDIRLLRQQAGMVLQLPYLFPGTISDNLLYPLQINKKTIEDEEQFTIHLLNQVGLEVHLKQRHINDLSVGQQMRVSLARTLANQPTLLLLDEPTSSLDPQSARLITQSIHRLNKEYNMSVLTVTHQRETAQQLGGRLMLLQNGQLTEYQSLESIPAFNQFSNN